MAFQFIMFLLFYIKDYALLADAEIEFGRGLNILTGETGTGTSILIGAIAGCLVVGSVIFRSRPIRPQ